MFIKVSTMKYVHPYNHTHSLCSILARKWCKDLLHLSPSTYRHFYFLMSSVSLFLIIYGWFPQPQPIWDVQWVPARYFLFGESLRESIKRALFPFKDTYTLIYIVCIFFAALSLLPIQCFNFFNFILMSYFVLNLSLVLCRLICSITRISRCSDLNL